MAGIDRGEEILQELAKAAEACGYSVGIDRGVPTREDELPLAIVRVGEEETDAVDPRLWFRRWTMMPSIELFVRAESPAAGRAEINRAWAAIVDAVRRGRIPDLIAKGSTIECERKPIMPSQTTRIVGSVGTFAFTFDR